MSIYEFTRTYTFDYSPRATRGIHQPDPGISFNPIAISQDSHIEGGRKINWEGLQTPNVDVEEFIQPGFRYLDDAMKHYWSDLRIPSKDSSRFVRVKIAGAAKDIQIWVNDLKNGRVELPVLSVSRTSHSYNVQKFSPPYINLRTRFTDKTRRRAIKDFRPVPYIVNYELTLWAEHKRDAENALYQMLIRFNPMAIIRATDGHWTGNVEMHINDTNDLSDKELGAEQFAKVRYSVSIKAEAWLALPSQVTSTVLGHVSRIRESIHNTLLA